MTYSDDIYIYIYIRISASYPHPGMSFRGKRSGKFRRSFVAQVQVQTQAQTQMQGSGISSQVLQTAVEERLPQAAGLQRGKAEAPIKQASKRAEAQGTPASERRRQGGGQSAGADAGS